GTVAANSGGGSGRASISSPRESGGRSTRSMSTSAASRRLTARVAWPIANAPPEGVAARSGDGRGDRGAPSSSVANVTGPPTTWVNTGIWGVWGTCGVGFPSEGGGSVGWLGVGFDPDGGGTVESPEPVDGVGRLVSLAPGTTLKE